MPSPIAHSATGYALAHFLPHRSRGSQSSSNRSDSGKLYSAFGAIAIYSIVISNLPDLDFLPQVISHMRFHRGPTHSLAVGLLLSLVCSAIAKLLLAKTSRPHQNAQPTDRLPSYKTILVFTLGLYLTHLLLDSVTAGGPGMQLLWPFSTDYLRAPFSLFFGVHHSRGLWDSSHIVFITAETIYSVTLIAALRLLQTRSLHKNRS